MSEINPSDLKVVDLRSELSSRNLSTKGKKDELIARLTDALASEKESQTNEESPITEEKVMKTTQDQTDKDNQSPEEQIEEKKPEDQTSVDNIEKQTPAKSVHNEVAEEKSADQQAEEAIEEKSVEKPVEKVTEEKITKQPVEQVKEDITEGKVVQEETAAPTKEEIVEKPSQQEATKENMDTDIDTGVKRKRSLDTTDNEEEKRVKVDTNTNNDVNSSAIYVKGFVRPLIIRHVQDLFSKYGTVKRFWMDSIKTHCYVIYENDTEAQEAFKNVNGIKFPEDTGRLLTVEGLTEAQVESLIEYEQSAADRRVKVDWEASIERVKSGLSLPSSPAADGARKIRSIGIGQVARQLAQAAEPTSTSLSREVRIERTQKPKDLSLDELFRKTAALPHLYYLPNTDEEAKAKLARLQNI